MECNLNRLKDFVIKATFNNSIDNVQIKIEDSLTKSLMMSTHKDFFSVLNFKTPIFSGFTKLDEFEFNFSEQNTYLLKLIDLIDSEEVDVKVTKKSMIFKSENNKVTVTMCSPIIVNVSNIDISAAEKIDYFTVLELDDNLIKILDKIKKIGNIYGKMYIEVENNELFINITDKKSGLESGFKTKIKDTKINDISCCFKYVNFLNMMQCLSSDKEYQFKFHYKANNDLMLLCCETIKSDDFESYFLRSHLDN